MPGRTSTLLAPLLLVLAGCAGPDGAPDLGTPGQVGDYDRVLERLAALPRLPAFDANAAVDRWERFVYDYPKRDWMFPHNEAAADFLVRELEAAGYDAEILEFPANLNLIDYREIKVQAPGTAKVVRGSKPGAAPDHRYALIAHYDTVTGTTMGAYDDASGTMLELELCKLLAQVPTNHTIDCLFFDAEERGLTASKAYAQAWREGKLGNFTYDAAFGYDMTGINWPGYAPWDLFAMVGTQAKDHPELENLTDPMHAYLALVLRDYVDANVVPGALDGVSVIDVHDRNSDEQNFKKQGVPTIRFSGGRNPAEYPQYHGPLDTPPYVYEFAGSKENFAQGYGFVVTASWYTILGLDGFDLWTLDLG